MARLRTEDHEDIGATIMGRNRFGPVFVLVCSPAVAHVRVTKKE